MRSLILVLPAALLLASTFAFAADPNVTGTWTGKAMVTPGDAPPIERTAILVLNQAGSTVTGTAGPSEDQTLPISNGKMAGSKLTFVVQGDDISITFNLTLDGDRLKGDATGSQQGTPLKVTIELTRTK